MADLYVCPRCHETEDCACSRVSRARSDIREHRKALKVAGFEAIRGIASKAPQKCTACLCQSATAAKDCPLCDIWRQVRNVIAEVEGA